MVTKTSDENTLCECQIIGRMLSPKSYTKVVSHDLRKKILHKLYALTIDLPITKYKLAAFLEMPYDKLNYQLNEHLNMFWTVKHREKVRGAYREYIAPDVSNTIYLNIGPEKKIYIIDPLANLIGMLTNVGTRCDQCSIDVRKKCLNELQTQICLQIDKEERAKREKVLEDNGRKRPFTPVDYMLVCTIASSLDSEPCIIRFTRCSCPFIEKLKGENISYLK